MAKGLGSLVAQARPPRPHPLGRGHRRRHVFLGKERGECVGKTKRGKGTKTIVLSDGRGLPLGTAIASARLHEVRLIEPLVEQRMLPKKPRCLIYDAAADSDPLRKRLWRRGIERVRPHREEPQEAVHPRWSQAPPLPSLLEDRALDRLAAKLPPARQLSPIHDISQ